MPEPESASPRHDPDARLGDLFENLPAPAPQLPTVDDAAPAPGSRRAAREAAAASRSTSDQTEVTAAPAAAAPAGVPDAPQAPSASAPSDASGGEHAPPTRVVPVVPEEERNGGRLEDLFETDSHDDGHRPKDRKKRRTGCLVALIILLAIVGGIAAGGAWVMNTYGDKISELMGWGPPTDYEPGQATGEVFVTINEGDTGKPVSTALFEAGVTKTEDTFYDYIVDEGVAVTFYPGVYRMQKKMTAEAALAALQDAENKLENSVNIIEGSTLKRIVPAISEELNLPLADVEAAVADPSAYGVSASSLEGWLFPAVYTFNPGVTATEVVQAMVDRTRKSLAELGVPEADAQRILTIASIIQREGRLDDFPKVSRVIENRLDASNQETHGLLQMDSNAQYGYGLTHEGPVAEWNWKDVVSDPNPWNTYVHKGLPAGPIAAPRHEAIDAAMNPAEGPWLYFVTVNLDTGETVFSATYEEQQKAEAQYQQWCKDNPDGGCY